MALSVEGDARCYTGRAPGVSLAQVAELRTGKAHVEATLDLHGAKIDAALARLRQFLVESRRIGRRRVLVVHGKGTHSEHGAPLREAVLGELARRREWLGPRVRDRGAHRRRRRRDLRDGSRCQVKVSRGPDRARAASPSAGARGRCPSIVADRGSTAHTPGSRSVRPGRCVRRARSSAVAKNR